MFRSVILLFCLLAALAGPAAAQNPADLFAFTRSTGEEKNDVFVVRLDGRGMKRLTTNGRGYDPALSPDHKVVVFGADGDIYRVNTDGTGKRRLAHVAGWDCRAPSVSYTGSRVVFTAEKRQDEPGAGPVRLYQMNLDGSGLRILHAAGGDGMESYSNPHLSPDNQTVVYNNSGYGVGEASVHLFSVAARRSRQIIGAGKDRTFYDCYRPVFSPDGRKIACYSACRVTTNPDNMIDDKGRGIVLMNANGTAPQLVFAGDVIGGPQWSRDGTTLIFSTNKGLHLIDALTRKRRFVPVAQMAAVPVRQAAR